jgi:RecB family exonuclease
MVRLRIRESVRAVLARALSDETWDFIRAEQAFGAGARSRRRAVLDDRDAWPAFEVADFSTEGAASLWLRGSIDRIDRTHDGAMVRVIDYKRSKNTVREASGLLGKTALQVPLYAAVAARALHVDATGAYWPMQPRDLATDRSRKSPDDRVREISSARAGQPSEIERRVLALVASARAGAFAPLPAREAECAYCSVSGGCRKPRFAMTPTEDVDEDRSAPEARPT